MYYFLKVQLIYNVVPISAIQQSDLVIYTHTHTQTYSHIYVCIYIYTHTFFFYVLLHHGLSQETRYSSLFYTVGYCCSSFLNVIACIYKPQTSSPSHTLPTSSGSFLCLWVCFCFLDRFICAKF